MTRIRLPSMSVVVALASVLLMSPTFAGAHAPAQQHDMDSATQAMPRPDAGSEPSRAELDRFAHAVVEVGNIRRAARSGIAGAATPAARIKLEDATVRKIKAAIRGNQLSVHRYLQIVAFVQTHPAVQKKVVALMKQLMPPLPLEQPLN